MRTALALSILIGFAPVAHAQPRRPPEAVDDAELDQSPLISDLQRKTKAGDKKAVAAFWASLATRGGPLVEPLAHAPHYALVTFVYRSASAKSVRLVRTGADERWPAELQRLPGSDVWARSYAIRDDARFGYGFGIDLAPGPLNDPAELRWRMRGDPLNPHRRDVSMSEMVMPNAPPQPLTIPAADVRAGAVHVHRVTSKRLGNSRNVCVYTPPGYDPSGAPYPLVVLFDGFAYFSSIPTATIVDNLIAHKRLPRTVVLAIDPVDRARELGLGETFADVVAGELVPWVQRRYHATSDPRAVVVGGFSLGGLAASFCAFRHPEVFGNVLSQSGSYWWFQNGDDEYEWLARQIAAAPRKPIRFYLDVGLLEGRGPPGAPSMVLVNRHLRDVLTAKGYPVSLRVVAGEHHASNWRGTLGDALAGLLGGMRPGRSAARRPTDDLKVDDLGDSLLVAVLQAAKLGGSEAALRTFNQGREHSHDVDEISLNRLGYALLYDAGLPPAAIAIFQEAATLFPQSGDARDSLAEAYYVAGDRANALSSYKKSLELDPHNENASSFIKLLGQP
jgi:enterochelin esterase family protein